MDGKRFDLLTKGLNNAASRRGILGGVGAVAAGLLIARTASAKARPINDGCDQAGRQCTEGSCCGSKLTCTEPTGLSSRCKNASGNDKCCFGTGETCKGHCECCKTLEGADTACVNGKCTVV